MENAFVLVNTEIESEEEVLNALEKILEVKEAYQLYGVYDIIIRVESDAMLSLKDAISRIRRIEGVRSLLTMVVIDRH